MGDTVKYCLLNMTVMIRSFLVIVWVLISASVSGQKFVSERGFIKFFSHATIEDITARNEKVTAMFDAAAGTIAFVVPINKFEFAKSLMQEHFNEKYLESERYPKSTFQGRILGYSPDATTEQSVSAQGKLTIHGVTRDVDIPGQIVRLEKGLKMTARFMVELKDYDIEIPTLMWQNIAERVEVTLEFSFRPAED
jgi:polyisoprenoid-binding protein YceI